MSCLFRRMMIFRWSCRISWVIFISLERQLSKHKNMDMAGARGAVLVVHGLLHLIGYDHQTEEDKSAMRAREEEVLAKLGLGR